MKIIFNKKFISFKSLNFIFIIFASFISNAQLITNDLDNELNWEWIKSALGNATSESMAVDPSGNIYVLGDFSDNLIFDDLTLSCELFSDMYLVKYDEAGNVIWGKSFGGEWGDFGKSVTTDNQGNVYITGQFCSNEITFGSITLVNNYITPYFDESRFDIFTVKLDSNGTVIWAKKGGGIYFDYVNEICIDNSGNVYIFGYFQSPIISFDTISLMNTGNWDIYLTKYDTNGNVVWARSAVGNGQENAWSVTTDNEGNIYICGSYRSNIIYFDNFTLTNTSTEFDIYLVKYDKYGKVIRVKSASGEEWDEAKSVTVDEDNNVYMTGYFKSDTLFFDSDTLFLSNNDNINLDMYVIKMDSNCNIIWSRTTEGSAWMYPKSICSYKSDLISIIGTFTGTNFGYIENFGSSTITPVNSYDIFVVNYDSSGNDIRSESIGGMNMDFAQDNCIDSTGNIYITADFDSDSIVIDTITLINYYNNKMFVAKGIIENSTFSQEYKLNTLIELSNFPNPFNIETNILYTVPELNKVEICIFNIYGNKIKVLVNKIHKSGNYSLIWDATNTEGRKISPGIYICKIQVGKSNITKKIVVSR
jgi:hypothetical protein